MRRVRCNRGFIVCGSSGREPSERRRERRRSEGRRRRRGGNGGNITSGGLAQPASQPACGASPPNERRRRCNQRNAAREATSELEIIQLRRKIKHPGKTRGVGGGFRGREGGQTGSAEQNQSCVPAEIRPIQPVILGHFSKDVKKKQKTGKKKRSQ